MQVADSGREATRKHFRRFEFQARSRNGPFNGEARSSAMSPGGRWSHVMCRFGRSCTNILGQTSRDAPIWNGAVITHAFQARGIGCIFVWTLACTCTIPMWWGVATRIQGAVWQAGHQHFSFYKYRDRGNRIFAGHANGSIPFQLAQMRIGPNKVPVSIVVRDDSTFLKKGIPHWRIFARHANIQYVMLL